MMAKTLTYFTLALLIVIAPGAVMALTFPLDAEIGDTTTFENTTLPNELAVYFKPEAIWVDAGDIFSVDLYADLPEGVIVWDLNLLYNRDIFIFQGATIGSDWAGGASNSVFISGAAFEKPISGSDILLASLSFAVDSDFSETASFTISVDDTELNLTDLIIAKGFSSPFPGSDLYQVASFGSVEVNINAVPEPATFLLVGIGLLGAGILRSKKGRKT